MGCLMSEKAETCFVLPLREAVAHFARRNTRSTDAKMGCSDNGNDAHTSINVAADFRVGCHSFGGSFHFFCFRRFPDTE
jgi:hypothetical protein